MVTAYLSDLGLVCALGRGKQAVRRALFAAKPSGVRRTTFFSDDRPLALGVVDGPVPTLESAPPALRSRNNALLEVALEPLHSSLMDLIGRFGPTRVGVIVGTSTSGIGETEAAIAEKLSRGEWPAAFHYGQQELGSPAKYLAWRLGLSGPTQVISTACSSSAKALASAARWLEADLVDVVLAGGADSLCRFTIAGFAALESVSDERCNPLSANRKGINIGEGAALFVVTKEPGPVRLAGWGETSDAHHMSAPEPSGRWAAHAMCLALQRAGISPCEVEYVNLHGTATRQNDAMESAAVAEVLGRSVPVSSTKPLTGHTLGAAGALEAALCWLSMVDNPAGELPPHHWDEVRDERLPRIEVCAPGYRLARAPRVVLSNSFAFGGNNAVLVLAQG